jgi:predicted ATPase
LLGRGGMGVVWRARQIRDDTAVALKLLSRGDADVPRLTERFMREARIASSLTSPHIVRVLDFGIDAAIPFIAMELLEGESLAARLERVYRLSPAETARIMAQVAVGLVHAHAAGVVHRDVKPDNIFLAGAREASIAKLLDFGIAKLKDPLAMGPTLTDTGVVRGTPQYMAPEQIQGARKIDYRADLWSMAVIAFECLTGIRPFRGDALGTLFLSICVEPPPVPSSFGVVLPSGFDAWFARAAHRDPAKRFQSAVELAEELAQLCAEADFDSDGTDNPTASFISPWLGETVLDADAPAVVLLALMIDAEPQLMQELGGAYNQVLEQHDQLVRMVSLARGGTMVHGGSGWTCILFGEPAAALDAAVQLQELAGERGWPRGAVVRWRMALDVCDRTPGSVGVAERDLVRGRDLCSIAHGGQVLISDALRARLPELPAGITLVDLGEHELESHRLAPRRLFQIVAPGLLRDFGPLRTERGTVHNLPSEATEFIGRSRELRELGELLEGARLITLVGPGGTGKSRLAVRAAAQRLGHFPDGVFFVPLAAVSDARDVASTVAGILGIVEHSERPAIDLLVEHLAGRSMLLVLDNFEQVTGAAPDLTRLLRAAPNLTLLVTSRVVLHLDGERVFSVLPLAVPAVDGASLEALEQNEAIALFLNRARRVDPEFALAEHNAGAVVEIVAHLDGLPLAIELAAARTRLFTPAQLARELAQKQTMLRDDRGEVAQRHRALHDVVAWSHDLLSVEERALFRRIAVFVGGFTAPHAARVAEGPLVGDVAATLYSLVDKSLLRREVHEGRERLIMLECVREFALEELDRTDERAIVRQRHTQVFRDLAAENASELQRPGAAAACVRLTVEEGNLRAALERCLREGEPDGVAIAASIWRYWQMVGRMQEGRRWLVELSAMPNVSMTARAAGLTALAGLAYWQADYQSAIARYREALGIYRDLGDRLNVGLTLFALSTSSTWSGDTVAGERLAAEALDIFEEIGAREQIGMVRMAQGFARWMQGDMTGARPLWELSIAIAREVGDHVEAAHKSLALASITFLQGDVDEALQSSINAMNELIDRHNVALTVMAIDWIAAMIVTRSPELGAQLAGAAAHLRGPLGGGMKPEANGLPDARAVSREKLGEDAFRRAYNAGRRLPLAQAVALARKAGEVRGTDSLLPSQESHS